MKNTENGRSMIEMLGVLAIIGVLSVAGIAGYSTAMKRYRSNEVINASGELVVTARTANGGEGLDGMKFTDAFGKHVYGNVDITFNLGATEEEDSVTIDGITDPVKTVICTNFNQDTAGYSITNCGAVAP